MNKSSCIKEKGFYINTIAFILFIILYGCNHSDIVHPIRKDIYETVYASGKIFAANEHTIFSTGNGILIKKLVYDGDTTKENLPLFQIKNITATSALKVSPGKINLLQQFSSPQNLQKNNYIFSDCDGIIYQTMIEKGEMMHINQPLALIGDAQKRIIKLEVDQQDINKIKVGERVLLKTDITGDTIYKATVIKVYFLMNEASQSFRVDASFNDDFFYPYIHSAVEANIIINEKKDALVIPRSAITGKDSLLIKANGKPQKIKVETGITSTDYAEIINGIDENTEVIIPQMK